MRKVPYSPHGIESTFIIRNDIRPAVSRTQFSRDLWRIENKVNQTAHMQYFHSHFEEWLHKRVGKFIRSARVNSILTFYLLASKKGSALQWDHRLLCAKMENTVAWNQMGMICLEMTISILITSLHTIKLVTEVALHFISNKATAVLSKFYDAAKYSCNNGTMSTRFSHSLYA